MSLLRRLGSGPGMAERRASSLGEILGRLGIGTRTAAGESVTLDRALRLGSVWACVNLIADTVGGLPVDAVRYRAGARLPVDPVPPFLAEPSAELLPLDWRRTILVSLLLHGNAFGTVTAVDDLGYPRLVELLDPAAVRVSRRPDGRYRWTVGRADRDLWPLGDLWHLPAYTVAGQALGLSPITYAAEAIGIGLAARRFGSQWFAGGGHPTGLLQSEQEIGPDVAAVVKSRFLEATSKGGEPAVLGAGLSYSAIQVAADESQFLETMRANVADVARFYNVPPEIIGGEAGGSLTYANVEQRGLDLLTYGLSRWVLRLESGLSRLIPRGSTVKLNTDALVRVDLLNRYRAHDVAVRAGWLSRNEVRELEDRPPIDGGDETLWPPYATSLPAEVPAAAADARSLPQVPDDGGRP